MSTAEGLFEAIKAGDLERVRGLLDVDPTLVHARGEGDLSPLMTATYWGRRAVVDLLLEGGAALDIHAASALGLTERAAALLDADPGMLGAYSVDGWTPLALAAYFGQAGTARLVATAQIKSEPPNE